MKVLHVCETVKGGTATYLNELIPLLLARKDKMQIKLLMPRKHVAEVPDIAPTFLAFFFCPNRLLGLPFLFLSTFVMLVRFRPDIVHAHSTFAGIAVRLLAPPFGAKIIYCPHGWAMDREQPDFLRRLYAWIEGILSRVTDRIIAISEHERKEGRRIGIKENKLELIYNGISSTIPQIEPKTWDDSRLRVLFIGRLDNQKGVDILLGACRTLNNLVCVRIIGASVVSGAFRAEGKCGSHIEMLGWKSSKEIYANIAACDVVVIPSRWEGFGLVAIEAMRQGKAVVAAKVGGLKELIKDRETGFFFPKEDAHSLKKIIEKLDRKELEKMGHAGRDRFWKYFTAELMAEQISDLYHRVYGGKEEVLF